MENEDIVYGRHAVEAAIEAGKVNRLYVDAKLKGKNLEAIKKKAQSKQVALSYVDKSDLVELSENGVHQGFVARVSPFAYTELSEVLANLTAKNDATLLILDGLTDPHNLGSIARTADATGVDAIIIPKHRAVGITPVATKASTGALEHVPVVRVVNLSQTLEKLKKVGFWVFGTDMAGTSYNQWNTQGKVALIIGNEGKGVGQNLKRQVDEMISIPMQGHVQSLNASVAAAVLMYKVYENRIN